MDIKFSKTALVSLFLSLLLIFQSCQVYKKVPLTLDEAVAANKKVQITTTDNRKINVEKIEKIDSTYYGHKIIKGTLIKYPLIENKILKIRELDPQKSTISTIAVTIGTMLIIIVTLLAITYEPIEFSDATSGN